MPFLTFSVLGPLRELGDDPVGHVTDQHRHADRHAALAGRAIGGADQRVDRLLDVGVGHHHHVVLRAAQRLHALAVVRAGLVDVLGDRGRSDKTQCLDVRMGQQRIDRDLVALDDVEHARRQPGLGQQLGHEHRARGIALAGLEDEGVAAGDGHGVHPHRDHAGEVERGDAGNHAQGLAQGPVVDAGGDLVGEVALEELGHTAGELDDVDAAGDFALGVGEDLAVFGGDHRGQGVAVLVEQAQEGVHDPRAADRGHVGPGGERGLGAGHGGRDFVDRGQRDLTRHRAGRGVPHRLTTPRGGRNGAPIDVVTHFCRGGEGFGCAHGHLLGTRLQISAAVYATPYRDTGAR